MQRRYLKEFKREKPPKIEVAISESEETTHFSIIDKWGNVVSNTYTLNTAYGSGIVPTGTGILMNNEMDDFSSKPGFPNAYGLVGSEANKIEPKKTPLSSMTPVIIFKQGRPFLVSGSPGGSTIITSVLQEVLNVLDFNMSLKESSSKSRIHFQHLPDILFHEELDKDVLASLIDNKKLVGRKLGEIHSILLKRIISKHFLIKDDQMAKQAHFKNNKLVFNQDSEISESSGVYKFFNSQNEILYIGKTKNLKKRVKSYLKVRKGEGKRISKLKSNIKYVETIITKTESDALILEQGLISKIRPPFNIQFRDDKSYPAIHLTTQQDFPAIYVSRQKNTKNTSFGPFANVGAMRLNVNLTRSLFKLRNCKDINFRNRSRPCIEYQMKRCSAPCVGYISKNEYTLDVKNAINFLSGDSKRVVKNLSKKMDLYSEKKDYERAIIYRDKIQSIRDTQKKQNVLTGFKELDVLAVRKNKFSTCLSVLKVEAGWINSSQNFYPVSNDDTSEEELLSAFLESYVVNDKKEKK